MGKEKKEIIKNTLLVLFSIFSLFVLAVSIGVWMKVYPIYVEARQIAYSRMALLEEENFKKPEDTKIVSKNGKLLKEINNYNYVYVTYEKVSPHLIDGYVAVEDKRFFEHGGVDHKAILRAGLVLLKNRGEIHQGGSSITQQVLKNNVLYDVKEKYVRKMAEFILAPTLETKYSKEKIMEFYLNTNFYGNNCYGIGAAAKFYFNKEAKDLELHEAALLVGLSNSPSRLNPLKHEQDALDKRNFVLSRMAEEGKISLDEAEQNKNKALGLEIYRELNIKDDYLTSYAMHSAVLALLEKDEFEFKYQFQGKEEQEEYKDNYQTVYLSLADRIRRGGYKIYSTLNLDIQKKAQETLDKVLEKEQERREDGRFALQASVAVVDNKTQEVIALVGGRGTEDEFNRGYQGFRQPGSAIKPLLVYAPAFETGHYYPSKIMVDKKLKEKDAPQNYGDTYFGSVSLREAVGRSINTLPHQIIDEIGVEKAISYLSKLQFKGLSYQDNQNKVMALGGFTYGTTVEEMARGYSTFANQGKLRKHSGIVDVKDAKSNKTLLNDLVSQKEDIYLEDTAYLMWDVLHAPVEEYYGTAQRNKIKNQVILGKTGTTNDEKDVWFIGFNDLYTVAVWVGYDTPRPMKHSFDKNYTGKIFRGVMEYLLEGKESQEIEKPVTVYESFVDEKGDPTSEDTGEKSYFSKTIEQRMKAASLEEEREKERMAQEERDKKDAELSIEIDGMINDLRKFAETLDVYDSIEIYRGFKTLEMQTSNTISKLNDKSRKEKFKDKVKKYNALMENREDIKRLVEEEKERRTREEKERLAQLNLLELTKAQSKVLKLYDYQDNFDYSDVDRIKEIQGALQEANNAVYNFNQSNSTEVQQLRKIFAMEKARLELLLQEKEKERMEYERQLFEQKQLEELEQREININIEEEQVESSVSE